MGEILPELENSWKKSFFNEPWKNTSEPLKNISCFRIVMWFPNFWRNKFFCRPVSWGALFHRENTVMNPQNAKCHRSPKMILFRHFWYFSITKAIHTYVLAKFEKFQFFFKFYSFFIIFIYSYTSQSNLVDDSIRPVYTRKSLRVSLHLT